MRRAAGQPQAASPSVAGAPGPSTRAAVCALALRRRVGLRRVPLGRLPRYLVGDRSRRPRVFRRPPAPRRLAWATRMPPHSPCDGARTMLSKRRVALDKLETISVFAQREAQP